MPLDNPNPTTGAAPVIKATAIGQHFTGVLCKFPERRQIIKDGVPQVKDNGQPRYELVLTMLAMPGTTVVVGKAGEERTIETGETVRRILKGGAYGDWIEAENAHKAISPNGARVGDIVEWSIDHAQAWNEDATKRGAEIRTQEQANAVPRGVSLGFYGPITLRAAAATEAEWDAKAIAAYNDSQRPEAEPEPFPAQPHDPTAAVYAGETAF